MIDRIGTKLPPKYIPKSAGRIWHVDTSAGNNNNIGTEPYLAFQTITAAITASSAGDLIIVKAGTYTEVGINLTEDDIEICFQQGVLIDPASGTAMTVSGKSCKLTGKLKITPAVGAIGLLISGDECVVNNSKVLTGAIGIQVTGSGVVLNDCAAGLQTVMAYDVQGIQGRLFRCKTVGNGATHGFKINGGADTGVLQDCTSTGHTIAGFYIETGSQDWTLLNCSSGAGDGRWVDVDHANVWSNFTFDDEVYHVTTFAGAGPTNENLFQVTGSVEIDYIYGTVTTILNADVDDVYLDLWDGTVSVEITDNGGGGTDTDSADVGSLLIKTEKATTAITLLKNDQGRVEENTSFRKPRVPFVLTQKKDTDTYVRLVYSGVATGGVIEWHCKWKPLGDSGFVVGL